MECPRRTRPTFGVTSNTKGITKTLYNPGIKGISATAEEEKLDREIGSHNKCKWFAPTSQKTFFFNTYMCSQMHGPCSGKKFDINFSNRLHIFKKEEARLSAIGRLKTIVQQCAYSRFNKATQYSVTHDTSWLLVWSVLSLCCL